MSEYWTNDTGYAVHEIDDRFHESRRAYEEWMKQRNKQQSIFRRFFVVTKRDDYELYSALSGYGIIQTFNSGKKNLGSQFSRGDCELTHSMLLYHQCDRLI
jgi:hypothetical protein